MREWGLSRKFLDFQLPACMYVYDSVWELDPHPHPHLMGVPALLCQPNSAQNVSFEEQALSNGENSHPPSHQTSLFNLVFCLAT